MTSNNYNKNSKNRSSKRTINICIVIASIFFALFVLRLVDWQIIHGEEYKKLATNSTGYTVETQATRGEILDKSGRGLVVNTTHYSVVLDKLYIEEEKLSSTLATLIDLMYKTGEKWEDKLPIEVNEANEYSYKKGMESEKNALFGEDILNASADTNAESCFAQLVKRYSLDKGYADTLDAQMLRDVVSVYFNMEVEDYSNTNPYVFAKDISENAVMAVSENTQGISGVDIQTYLIRKATDPDLAPHILGALGSLTETEYKELSQQEKGYNLNDEIGKFGIELACESYLRGTGGTKIVKRNSEGAIVDTIQTIDAQPGNTVYLTIDADLQKIAVKSLAENVKAAKKEGVSLKKSTGKSGVGEDCEAGAVVMLSVKDFSVLAAASYPTYDLNKYSEYGDYYIKLSENKNSPMYNRAFVGSFACGSVIKPCVAATALEEKVIKEDTEIYCKQNYDYYPTNVVRCMHYHSDLDVLGAITASCNYYFAEAGRRLGIDTLYLYEEKFGLGEYTGIEIEESKGMLAGRDSQSWMPGNTVQAAIGQSDNAFTPLQLATYAATIANDGTRLKTHIIDKITNYEATQTIKEYTKEEVADKCGISQKNLDIVKKSMLNVTQSEDGTAYYMFGDYKVKVAAKTGTAENAGSDHTTFICYAPYDNPEVAISVVIENGAKGRYSMQVAKDMLDAYFNNKSK